MLVDHLSQMRAKIGAFEAGWLYGFDSHDLNISARETDEILRHRGIDPTPENVSLFLNGIGDGARNDRFRLDGGIGVR